MKKATSMDVARLAEVSQSTVSFVLNNRKDISISDNTRKKVLAAAEKLNYIPNSFAAGLRTNRSKLIGLLMPTITNPYFPLLTQFIEEYATAKGYNILLCNTYRKPDNEKACLNLLAEKSVDGILYLFTPTFTEYINEASKSTPIVMIGEKMNDLDIHTIGLDSIAAGEMIAQHLISKGHKHFAFISTPMNEISVARIRRYQGVKAKLEEHGLAENLILETSEYEYESTDSTYEIEIGFNIAKKILENKNDTTAFIGVNDMVAFGIMNYANIYRIKVPDDISICGFDNIYLSRVLQPGITTIDHLLKQRARLAMDMLLDLIDSKDINKHVTKLVLEPDLIIRGSTSLGHHGMIEL
jgi:LacI family transcriptional regulator